MYSEIGNEIYEIQSGEDGYIINLNKPQKALLMASAIRALPELKDTFESVRDALYQIGAEDFAFINAPDSYSISREHTELEEEDEGLWYGVDEFCKLMNGLRSCVVSSFELMESVALKLKMYNDETA